MPNERAKAPLFSLCSLVGGDLLSLCLCVSRGACVALLLRLSARRLVPSLLGLLFSADSRAAVRGRKEESEGEEATQGTKNLGSRQRRKNFSE